MRKSKTFIPEIRIKVNPLPGIVATYSSCRKKSSDSCKCNNTPVPEFMIKYKKPLKTQYEYSAGRYVHTCQLRANKMVMYYKYEGKEKTQAQKKCNLLDNFKGSLTYTGEVTDTSKKNLSNAIDIFCQALPEPKWIQIPMRTKKILHHFAFITLTISCNERRIAGKEAYQILLDPFIQWLKRVKKCNTYIWKAELQSALDFNGNMKKSKGQLHYHLFIPNYIDKMQIRNKWNELQRKNGLLDGFFAKKGHYNAPSTKIEKPIKHTNVCDYITKEVTKSIKSSQDLKQAIKDLATADLINDFDAIEALSEKIDGLKQKQLDSICGKVWGCSENLQPKKGKSQFYSMPINKETEKKLWEISVTYPEKKNWQIQTFSNDFVDIWKVPPSYLNDILDVKKEEYYINPQTNTIDMRFNKHSKAYKKHIKNQVGYVSTIHSFGRPTKEQLEKAVEFSRYDNSDIAITDPNYLEKEDAINAKRYEREMAAWEKKNTKK